MFAEHSATRQGHFADDVSGWAKYVQVYQNQGS